MSYEDAEQQYILWKDRFSEVKKLPLWALVTEAIETARETLVATAKVILSTQAEVDMAERICACMDDLWPGVDAYVQSYICIGGNSFAGELVIQLK
jgi:hypothetical protein